ncbi:unnamed protein product [Rhizophagus irregularis]|nr:unnamed protein product [Rhizophagus irregularis]
MIQFGKRAFRKLTSGNGIFGKMAFGKDPIRICFIIDQPSNKYFLIFPRLPEQFLWTSCTVVPPKAVLAGLLGFSGKWKEVGNGSTIDESMEHYLVTCWN